MIWLQDRRVMELVWGFFAGVDARRGSFWSRLPRSSQMVVGSVAGVSLLGFAAVATKGFASIHCAPRRVSQWPNWACRAGGTAALRLLSSMHPRSRCWRGRRRRRRRSEEGASKTSLAQLGEGQ